MFIKDKEDIYLDSKWLIALGIREPGKDNKKYEVRGLFAFPDNGRRELHVFIECDTEEKAKQELETLVDILNSCPIYARYDGLSERAWDLGEYNIGVQIYNTPTEPVYTSPRE